MSSIYSSISSNQDFAICYIFLAFLTSLLHIIGIVLLVKVKSDLPNQRIILVSLAFSELLFCLPYATLQTLAFENTGWGKWENYPMALQIINYSAIMTARIANRLMMIYFISDRYLAILLHMKYKIIFTKQRVVKLVALLWLICIIHTLIYGFLTFKTRHLTGNETWSIITFTGLTLDVIIVLSGFGTYIYFFMKVFKTVKSDVKRKDAIKKHKDSESGISDTNARGVTGSSQRPNTRSYRRKFLVPILIVLTYILFNISAVIMYQVRLQGGTADPHDNLLRKVAGILVLIGFMNDAILYIFVQRNIRNYLYNLLPCM